MSSLFNERAMIENCNGDLAYACEVADSFIRTLPEDLLQIFADIRSDRRHDLNFRAHRLSRELFDMGADVAAQSMRSLEVEATTASKQALNRHFHLLVADTFEFSEALKDWVVRRAC